MAEFLLELLSEEIPAGMQARAADDLKRLVTDKLKDAGLTFDSAEACSTPRRLTLVVDGLPEQQPDVREERKGPKADAPDKAVQGFLKSVGLTRDQLEERETKKGKVLFAVMEKKGQPTPDVLFYVLADVLRDLPWPKSMRSADDDMRWVRPLHRLVAVFGGVCVPFAATRKITNGKWRYAKSAAGLEGLGKLLVSNNQTMGHRFYAPEPFQVKDFADYKDKLRKAHVILDPAERREIIKTGADELAAKDGLTVIEDKALLSEVAGLVEWPVVLMGKIDAEFMGVPREVLTATMLVKQKYFSLHV